MKLVTIMLVAAIVCSGCVSDRYKLSNVQRIHDGQSLQEVEEIMGKPDSVGTGIYDGSRYTWHPMIGTIVFVEFADDKVIHVYYDGLKL